MTITVKDLYGDKFRHVKSLTSPNEIGPEVTVAAAILVLAEIIALDSMHRHNLKDNNENDPSKDPG